MALIPCPNCGQLVSEKAVVCPRCKHQIAHGSAANTVCPECGTQYIGEQGFCPACGCPNNTNAPAKKKHRGIAVTAIVLSVILIVGLLGAFAVGKWKAAVYRADLETVTYKMLDGAANAETAGNLIKSVWYNAIYEKRDASTDKYTLKNGKFVDDFNDALDNLFSDEEFQKNISAIRTNQDETATLMKRLRNPPKKYAEEYSVLSAYYDNYLSLTKMVISPTGSLQSFSDEFHDADVATVDSYEKMKLLLD